jgi:DNA-binding beta-propeller fold protein YncE
LAVGQHTRALLLGLGFVPGAIVLAGCAQRQRPIFEERYPALVWPAPPAPPKIRYVGELTSEADLKPARKPLAAIGEFFVGAEEPEPLYGPRSAVCTPDGQRVWIADPGGRCLHLFDLRTRSYKRIRSLNDAQLLSPVDVCLGPEDSVYVCDSEFVAIHRIAADSGAWLETLRIPEEVLRPAAIDYDPAADELYVVDSSAHDVKVLSRAGSLRRIVGHRGSAPGEFNFPCDIVGDGDMIWVVDAGNHRVQGLTRAGRPVIAFGQAGDAPGDLALPKGVALDSQGHIYVVDARFENIQTFDRSGRLLLAFGQEGTEPGEFWLPASIFIDARDRIWVCDTYNGRVQVFDYLKDELAPDGEELPAETQPAATRGGRG